MDANDSSEEDLIYDIKGNNIKIFGDSFVHKNKNKCKMIIDNKEYEITEYFNITNYNNNKLKIKLKGIENVTDMSNMFSECSLLLSLPGISKWNVCNVTDIKGMFYKCSLLISLPDISKWNKVMLLI